MLIGRLAEQKQLQKCYSSDESEFVVIYGRRRIGKTYLVKEFFTTRKCLFFHATGLQHGNQVKQLTKFSETLSTVFFNGAQLKSPRSWGDALNLLHTQMVQQPAKQKIIIFLDELPWMATRKSGLLEEIDY